MNEDKRFGGQNPARAPEDADDKQKSAAASRARNRTVMLTPEMTGQVRAMLYQDPDEGARDALTELLPPLDWSRPDEAVASAPAEEPFEPVPEYGRDINPPVEQLKTQRASTTGKIDVGMLAEALSENNSPVHEQRSKAGAQSVFSVNPNVTQKQAPYRVQNAPQQEAAPRHSQAPTSKVVGFLVSFDKDKNGEIYEIRSGRWLLTSRPTDHGEYILLDDETISPLHAIVRATKDGKIQVLDQLSEFGTGVQRVGADDEEEVAGAMVMVEHGDVLRFGQRHFVVCIIPQLPQTHSAEERD